MNKNIWIGLAEIRALNVDGQRTLKRAKEGFVNILAIAHNKEEFVLKAENELNKLGLGIEEMIDFELLSERKKKARIQIQLLRLAEEIDEEYKVRLGTIHTY